ncbi:nucleotide-diphospho-sugar transferases [Lucifera butyrica]|uniref:Nucleotide-diphospho-sugar transferases n=1 Tax=Lucifera butyrica TaxID=1351585 RepID=A0A498RA73_9FIRM|nr:glycosyltransferase [Lucifera butyrica]VBB09596.1 nucleotide-diphospho-sugar transferases [Lucifera butyrica]
MQKKIFLQSQSDYLYLWILSIDVIIAVAMLCSKTVDRAVERILHDSGAYGLAVGAVLIFSGVAVIAWRIWMACRYKVYAPVKDEDLPVVTVVIPAYNEGRQILHTVRSVMNSDYPSDKMRVICVDDGSLDDTWHWMCKAQGEYPSQLYTLRQTKNKGKRHALMAGFVHATDSAVYVTIDSDSEVVPHTLRHLVSPIVTDFRVGAVAGNVKILNLGDGAIPKMMDVFFTTSFDFIRAGQSVYGGVFCTPGALSAYRVSTVNPHLTAWADQTFMGIAATIGEDRAMTNIVLKNGFRVVYQRDAVVLTKVPVTLRGLQRMLLRWARSNVRESLVLATIVLQRFRHGDSGSGWIRMFSFMQLFQLTVGETLKLNVFIQLFSHPLFTFLMLTIGGLFSSIVPATIYYVRYNKLFGWRWAAPYSMLSLYVLSWISFWGLMSAARSGWLTREISAAKRLPAAP